MKSESRELQQTATLSGKVAIVTGASRGIGRAIAIALAEAGAHVVIHYREQRQQAMCTVKACEALGVRAIAVQADVGVEADVQRLFLEATQLGNPSILVNNAGIAHYGLLMDLSLMEWEKMLQTNLTSTFLCCREAIPYLKRASGGRIINLASVHGLRGAAMEAAYSASKAGVIALTESLAVEVGSLGITVNAVAPGVIDTDMMQGFSAQERRQMQEETPVGRLGTPVDVANVVAFLASEASSFITGQVISPNGGRLP
ncbi:3-oxoacyl-ACP reductase FabG [Alicyclobacillus fastidiosus]|uniref:3-oxoacyl-ACP reductase FabG n=1 Tax=Alicyclobacillus fastidiosus TaxID=392011 RepID=A0ABY6ZC25_9BACL|nr:3-oxoacyl-ACP reductase FabG [Alicyclobacillus fastidiosus]WAH40448.1 3-oxoacyl-ACP reductase FabG [Alicyclobacillus fastidiosus]GMA61850.1 beta-ketoacyl-ACP reductase [Alicyclobacillus fastidiosus]